MRTGRFGPLVALDYCPACEVAPLIRRSGGLRCGSCKEEFEIDPNPKRDLVPDILAAHDDIVPDELFEKSGVHVGVQLPFPARIVPGDVLDLSFVLQNCWDTERTVAPMLSPERRSFLPQMDVAFESDPAAKMTLSGGKSGAFDSLSSSRNALAGSITSTGLSR